MTAEQIVLEAWQRKVTVLEQQIADLEARQTASQPARQKLSELQIVEAQLFKKSPGFLEWPAIELEVSNTTSQRIYSARLRVSLRHPDQPEPWLVEDIDRVLERGLKAGARGNWRIDPEAREWREVTVDSPNDVFVIEVLGLKGLDGEVIASSDFGSVEELKLRESTRQLEALRASKAKGF
jgi:hypothetical protein